TAMNCVRLGVGVTLAVALATASWAQDRPAKAPLEFAPDDVRPDGGAKETAQETAPAPAQQEEDREAAPITKRAGKPAASKPAPKPAVVAAPPPKPAPAPAKPEKAKKQVAQKAPPPPTEPPPPVVPPHVTLHVWEPERTNRFAPEEAIESAMGEVL